MPVRVTRLLPPLAIENAPRHPTVSGTITPIQSIIHWRHGALIIMLFSNIGARGNPCDGPIIFTAVVHLCHWSSVFLSPKCPLWDSTSTTSLTILEGTELNGRKVSMRSTVPQNVLVSS